MAPLRPLDHESFAGVGRRVEVIPIINTRANFRFSVHVHEIQ
jgi:hypothetical protein